MPQVFKVGSYWIYFWVKEGVPLEPIHVHIAEGRPSANATKVWITRNGNCLIANNNSNIPVSVLRNIVRIIEARSEEVITLWEETFGKISYYC